MSNEPPARKRSRFFNVNVFFAICCLATVGRGLNGSYLTAMATTMERRFNLNGRQTGLLVGSIEFGYISTVLIGSYIGTHFHLPRCISVAILLMGTSFFLMLLPFFVSLRQLATPTDSAGNSQPSFTYRDPKNLVEFCRNGSAMDHDGNRSTCAARAGMSSSFAYNTLLTSRILSGASGSLITPLTLTYIDNNCNSQYSSFYNGGLIGMYSIGSIGGFLLANVMTKINEFPWLPVPYDDSDSRWIGAWWLGFVFAVGIELIVCVPVFFFPRALKRDAPAAGEADKALPDAADSRELSLFAMIGDFFRVLWTLLRNPAFLALSVINAMTGWIIGGYGAFSAKYMEYHFQVKPSTAAFFIGLTAVFGAAGVIVGGLIISWIKLSPMAIMRTSVAITIFIICFFVGAMMLSCEQPVVRGLPNDASLLATTAQCQCTPARYYPICDRTSGVSYLNPCVAGCQLNASASTHLLTRVADEQLAKCSLGKWEGGQGNGNGNASMTVGLCATHCERSFIIYVTMLCLATLLRSTMVGPHTAMLLRCVRQDQKVRTTALSGKYTLGALLAWLPAPIAVGTLYDTACLFALTTCDGKSACRLFLRHALRWRIHWLAIACKCVTLLLEIAMMFILRRKQQAGANRSADEAVIRMIGVSKN